MRFRRCLRRVKSYREGRPSLTGNRPSPVNVVYICGFRLKCHGKSIGMKPFKNNFVFIKEKTETSPGLPSATSLSHKYSHIHKT